MKLLLIISVLVLKICVLCTGKGLPGSVRISGGSDAAHGSAPYNVMVLFRNALICAGSILSKRTIITSKQCVDMENPSSFSVVTNTTRISNPGKLYRVSNVKQMEWSGRTHDLALLFLEKDIEFSKEVKAIEVSRDEVTGELETVARGWGLTNSDEGIQPDNLQEISLQTLDLAACKQKWQGVMEIEDDEICAVAGNGGGLCYGDAGGALVHNGRAIGVSSWGYGCAFGKSDVFTNLVYHYKWIKDNLK